MNYNLITYGGGGIFSIFMDLVVPCAMKLTDADKFYITVKNNQLSPPQNCFDWVFEQSLDESYVPVDCGFKGGFRNKGISLGAVEDYDLKPILNKFKIRNEILDQIVLFPDALGVHFRGGDMNKRHPESGIFSYDDYRRKIEWIEPKRIFIASDNYEVIDKLSMDFSVPVHWYGEFIRGKDLNDDTYKLQLEKANSAQFYRESFIEMLTLAGCDSLLCRMSNLSNAAIAYSDNIKIYRL